MRSAKKVLFTMVMLICLPTLVLIACGKKVADKESIGQENKVNQEIQLVDENEQAKSDENEDYIPADEYVVKNELDILATGLRMQDSHKHDDGSRCNIDFLYESNYSSVEFTYYPESDDERNPFLRLEMQNNRIRVLLHDKDEKSILLETEGMIDNVNPDKLKMMAETLMNYESVENVGIENIDGNMYWVENVKYEDNEIVQFLVCSTGNGHSMVKYGDKYLPVVSYKSDREVVLDGSHECSLDEINSAVQTNIPEEVLDEWVQWLNNLN